jgi:hypothetical protein
MKMEIIDSTLSRGQKTIGMTTRDAILDLSRLDHKLNETKKETSDLKCEPRITWI